MCFLHIPNKAQSPSCVSVISVIERQGERDKEGTKMVLWEITLGTAYFLGLKRTYRLALRIQRRLIKPKHHKIRQFLQRRTRSVFDVVLKVHLNLQQRDIEVGKNLGNWILRWLDRMKPSAQIRGPPPTKPQDGSHTSSSMLKKLNIVSNSKPSGTSNKESSRHLSTPMGGKPFPLIAMMMRPPKHTWTGTQFRNSSFSAPNAFASSVPRSYSRSVIREDIMQWMLQN